MQLTKDSMQGFLGRRFTARLEWQIPRQCHSEPERSEGEESRSITRKTHQFEERDASLRSA